MDNFNINNFIKKNRLNEDSSYNNKVREFESLSKEAEDEFESFFTQWRDKYQPQTIPFDEFGLDPVMSNRKMWDELLLGIENKYFE